MAIMRNTLQFLCVGFHPAMELKSDLKGLLFDFWLKLKMQKLGFVLFFTCKIDILVPLKRHQEGHFTCKNNTKPIVYIFKFNQKSNKSPLRSDFNSMT